MTRPQKWALGIVLGIAALLWWFSKRAPGVDFYWATIGGKTYKIDAQGNVI